MDKAVTTPMTAEEGWQKVKDKMGLSVVTPTELLARRTCYYCGIQTIMQINSSLVSEDFTDAETADILNGIITEVNAFVAITKEIVNGGLAS